MTERTHKALLERIARAAARIDADPRGVSDEDYTLLKARRLDRHYNWEIDVDRAIECGFLTEADR